MTFKKKYYKFKSCNQFEFILDIIINKRLFCSDLHSFNDPFESNLGLIFSESKGGISNLLQVYKSKEKIEKLKQKFLENRVLSFTTNIDSHLMWCHYANAFTGIAIEFELLKESDIPEKVSYGQFVASMNESEVNPCWTEEEFESFRIRKTLLNKQYHWEYEDEYRIITKDKFIPIKVTKVIMGFKINDNYKKNLELLCSPEALNIPLCITGIGDEGVDPDCYSPTNWYKK